MLINAIRAENLKSRHSHMWVAVLILPLLTAAIGAIIYGINASANLYDGAVWQQLWLQMLDSKERPAQSRGPARA